MKLKSKAEHASEGQDSLVSQFKMSLLHRANTLLSPLASRLASRPAIFDTKTFDAFSAKYPKAERLTHFSLDLSDKIAVDKACKKAQCLFEAPQYTPRLNNEFFNDTNNTDDWQRLVYLY